MQTVWIVSLIVLVVALIVMAVLYFVGNKMQEKQYDQKQLLRENAQPVSMLIIDKKILPIKDAHLPKSIMEQITAKGKRYARSKVPVVKVKVGPQIMTLICDDAIYEDVPSRGEVKGMVSGIYLISVKSTRKNKAAAPEEDTKKKKGGFRQRMVRKQAEYQRQLDEEMAAKKNKELQKAEKAKKKKSEERARKITV